MSTNVGRSLKAVLVPGIFAVVLTSGVTTPHETRAAPGIKRGLAELSHQPFAANAASAQVVHRHAGKSLLTQRQIGQVDAGGEIACLQRIRAGDPARVGKVIGSVPLQGSGRGGNFSKGMANSLVCFGQEAWLP